MTRSDEKLSISSWLAQAHGPLVPLSGKQGTMASDHTLCQADEYTGALDGNLVNSKRHV